MSHCVECGAALEADDQFCPACGKVIAAKTGPEQVKTQKAQKDKGLGLNHIISALTILIFVSSIVFFTFTVTRTSRMVPDTGPRLEENRCVLEKGELACLHAAVHTNAIAVTVTNYARRGNITVEHISIEGCHPLSTKVDIAAGDKAQLLVRCEAGSLGQYVEKAFTLLYTDTAGTPVKAGGSLTGIAQQSLKAAAGDSA